MENTYWHKQTSTQALYDDMLWNKPQQRNLAGKLAIIGGNAQGFNSVSLGYNFAQKAGIGINRTLMPDSLKKVIGKSWPECEFSLSTKSGGFSSRSLADWLSISEWADGVLLSGDLGQNSETSILLEHYIHQYNGKLNLTGDSVNIALGSPLQLLEKNTLTLTVDLSQLQKFVTAIRFPSAIKSSMSLIQLVDLLHSLSQSYDISLITLYEGQAIVADQGQISSTAIPANTTALQLAAVASVWQLQQPTKIFEAMTTAMFELNNP